MYGGVEAKPAHHAKRYRLATEYRAKPHVRGYANSDEPGHKEALERQRQRIWATLGIRDTFARPKPETKPSAPRKPQSARYGGRPSRPVVCVETKKPYPSIRAAAVVAKRSPAAISLAIRKGHKSAGFHWRYES